MSKVLVSASHFDTLCQDAWKLFEDNGIDVVFDPAKEFPAYTTEEIENHPDREDIVAAQTCNASSQGYGKRSLDQIHRK